MGRLTRTQTQERNRAKVLAAARAEFIARGFRSVKIDDIAERADLTRGAVYSNFPGKRALYFAVLADDAERASGAAQAHGRGHGHGPPGDTVREALGAFARAWVARLPLATDEPHSAARLGMDLMSEVIADEGSRQAFAQLMKLDALLLGLALERLRPRLPAADRRDADRRIAGRRVAVAEAALTTLHGARQLAAAAPGFVEPFNVVSACAQLADLDLGDTWQPPHLPHTRRARTVDEAWSPPPATDAAGGGAARLTGDGVVAILGLHRLAAIEEAVRAAPAGLDVTAVLVSDSPKELLPLARLTVAELRTCLQEAVAPSAWPSPQIVYDETGALAEAAGVSEVDNATEIAVRIQDGRIVARAEGFGACHAAATAEPARRT
ncbi:TetR/AcrR family transcriptional regulator [Actinopolymorpha alba]|uniref:TetR/AcrR family transcriptional regulator n=1 Tax=Actinopolymorpha alba TaxID=533267 RepID=UPI0003780763|nr:TetR/AcrR family transcriptional regulator [Actinopolymorpha alba]